MKRQRFTAVPPLAVYGSLIALLLILPLLYWLPRTANQQQRLEQILEARQTQLLAHRQAAEKINASQRDFDRRQDAGARHTPDLLALSLIGQSLRADVALISVEIDNAQHLAHLVVVADSLNALLDLTTRLQKLSGGVKLESHSPETAFKGRWKVKAALTMEYLDEK